MSDAEAGPYAAEAVVMDIEGTIGSLAHVRDVLFPYARRRLARWVGEQWRTGRHSALLRDVRAFAGDPGLDEAGIAGALAAWSDADVKAPPLKGVQALIWAEGYADGSLQGHVYPEVPESLDRWRRAGIARYIYSSGTRAAQHNWFAHSNLGDLTTLLDGYFDLDDAGGKRDPESYGTIAHTIGVAPETIVFLSDVREELDAAVLAGWHAVGVRRPGDPRGATVGGRHPTVCSLDAVHLMAADRPDNSTATVTS
ncbi:acireductone synthase [Streptomyces atratus]|uniref:acireductone synthase n=1 Tax=Streptomyces atratus TaxID=1893 RepID=UPI0021A84B82|nr:acireductone synthase [Streptomyces atratus]MCT2548324.1 acireductone synthase [Streptomyces atratus]